MNVLAKNIVFLSCVYNTIHLEALSLKGFSLAGILLTRGSSICLAVQYCANLQVKEKLNNMQNNNQTKNLTSKKL